MYRFETPCRLEKNDAERKEIVIRRRKGF